MKKHGILLTLIPVLLIMAMIFAFSAQTGAQSGGLSARIVRWLMAVTPGMSALPVWQQDSICQTVELVVRKCGHLTEFAALGFFLLLHISQIAQKAPVKTPWLWAWCVGTAYAATDELHQMFVGGRNAAATDVLIDSIGVAVGAGILAFLLKKRKRG